MNSRVVAFVSVTGLATALAVWHADPGPSRRPKVVAVVNNASVAEQALDGLKQGLAERGWRENDTIRFRYLGIETSPARLTAQTREHIADGADLVVALSTPAAVAAQGPAVEARVPMLLSPASDPMAAGLVSSLTHPGQAITGVTFALQEARRLEWLTRLVPNAHTVWVPYNHADPSPSATMTRLRDAARKLGLTLIGTDVRTAADLQAALADIPPQVDAILVPPDAFIAGHMASILATANERRLPVTTPHRHGVTLGALYSYGFSLPDVGRQAARLADRILSGTPATDLPIEAAEMDLSINVATAERLGIEIPDDVLRHAIILGTPTR